MGDGCRRRGEGGDDYLEKGMVTWGQRGGMVEMCLWGQISILLAKVPREGKRLAS